MAQYYTPVKAAPARRAERFVAMLRKKHHITVLTGMPSYPTGVLQKKYRGKVYHCERLNGIRIHRAYELPVANVGFIKRVCNFISFGISAVLLCGRIGPQDVIIASSPPPTVLLAGYIIRRIKRAKFVADVRDLWPRSAVELGYFKENWSIKIIDKIAIWLYRKADAVLCVSPGMKKELARCGIKTSKIHVVHNTAEIIKNRCHPVLDTGSRDSRLCGNDKRGRREMRPLISFVGNLSKSYDFIALADTAKEIAAADFLVVGDGEEKEMLRKHLLKMNINNVRLMKSVSAKEARRIISQSDLGILPLRDTKLTGYTLPAKVFEYMASGVPVAGFCRGQLCDILKTSGFIAKSPDAKGLIEAVKKALSNHRTIIDKGQEGRKLLSSEYSYQKVATELQKVVDRVA